QTAQAKNTGAMVYTPRHSAHACQIRRRPSAHGTYQSVCEPADTCEVRYGPMFHTALIWNRPDSRTITPVTTRKNELAFSAKYGMIRTPTTLISVRLTQWYCAEVRNISRTVMSVDRQRWTR